MWASSVWLMQICSECKTTYAEPAPDLCPRDHRRLVNAEDFWASDGDTLLGRTIAGRFTILSRIGVGGMGTVYRAEQASMGRMVAVKILKATLNRETDTVTRFHREAKATSLLQHPNTVTVFDFGQTKDGMLYLVMELLEGELLTKVLEKKGALPLDHAVRIARQILGSLGEAHEQGIIHRDLKPDNVYVTRLTDGSEHIKVLDFGIAKVFQSEMRIDALETQAGIVFGTPRYMSPEQAQSKPLDGRSDLYTVGVLLYQMVTGQPPFPDEDAVVVMARHIKTRPLLPSELRADLSIPQAVDDVLARSLEKDPARRPQTAQEFAAALEGCTAQIALPPSQRPTYSRRPRAARAPIFAAAGAAALLVAGAGLFALGNREERTAVPPALVAAEASLPAASPAEPPPVRFARIRIDTTPPDAEVRREGVLLGSSPIESMETMSERSVLFTITREGYAEEERRVVPTTDMVLSVQLAPVGPGARGGAAHGGSPGEASSKNQGPYERFDQF
jgi:serine/threonine-protein kinase